MKKISFMALLIVTGVIGKGLVVYSQPNIPKQNIPSDIPFSIRQQIERLYSSSPDERGKAAVYLGERGEKAVPAIPFLIEMLNDKTELKWSSRFLITSPGVESAEALVKIGKPAVDSLIAILKDRDRDPYVRGNAAGALGRIKDSKAVYPLIAGLKDKDAYVRGHAAWALEIMKDPSALKSLIEALNDEDPAVRMHAAIALGEIRDPDALKPLIAALKDKVWNVSIKVVEALSEFGEPAVEAIISTLKNENLLVRITAIVELGNIKDPRAVNPLISLLKDENLLVRINVAEALKKITGKDFGQNFEKWRKWQKHNKGVREFTRTLPEGIRQEVKKRLKEEQKKKEPLLQSLIIRSVTLFDDIRTKYPKLSEDQLFEVASILGNALNLNAKYFMLYKNGVPEEGKVITDPGFDYRDTSDNIPDS